MIKFIYNSFLNLDKKVKTIVNFGFMFSIIILLFSTLILCTYTISEMPLLYYIGLSTFKLSIIYFITFFCFGFAFNKITEE